MNIGSQYDSDDPFKKAARLHQSRYRASVLKVDCCEYGNRLTETEGRALLNYYPALGVREALRARYPDYSSARDADMLRSEHIPFNLLAPLANRPELLRNVFQTLCGIDFVGRCDMKMEWAPSPAQAHLGDMTSFDVYIQGRDSSGDLVGVGIEVKYTERGYRMGTLEASRVADPTSTYWRTTRDSGLFLNGDRSLLAGDDLRQIWRNHLLGLSMVLQGGIAKFVSLTLYPAGNQHFAHALSGYAEHLTPSGRGTLFGRTFEHYISNGYMQIP